MSACILTIDPGSTGGAALHYDGKPRRAWTVSTAAERRLVIASAKAIAAQRDEVLVVIVEKWSAGGERGHAQILGLGSQAGRWLEALELAGIDAADVVRVYPQTWRTVLAPMPRKTGEQAKASARVIASGHLGLDVPTDAAEAVCMGLWAAGAEDVAEVVTKLQRRAERARRKGAA